MQLRWFVLFNSAGLMLLSHASTVGAVNLIPMEEPVTTLVSPPHANPVPSAMHYDFAQNGAVVTMLTSTPLLCANTSTPIVPGVGLNIVYYSGYASGLSNPAPLPFVFGASSTSPSVSAVATGAQGVGMTPSMTFSGDDLGSLVCYGLDSNGTRRLTRDLFEDGLDGASYDSSVAVSVFALPADGNLTYDYAYTIDVTVPPLPAGTNCSGTGLDCNFVIMEGYDSSVFSTTSGGWCQASLGTQSCSGPTTLGNVYFSIPAPIAPAAAKSYRFVAYRSLRSGIAALPDTGAPVVIAALFSPNDLDENKLDDNVSTGNNQKSNAAPSVTQDATFTSFAGSLAGLSENTDSGMLTFDIGDPDTADVPAGGSLHATVSLTIGGLSASVPADCSTTLGSSGGSSHACKVDIGLNNGNWWNTDVSATYDGLFNAVATDATNGSYAPGVTASLQITAIDALGKASAPLSVPVHIHSTANNAPVVTFGGAMPNTADSSQGGSSFPTYSCSIGTNNCGATFHVVELDGLITALPGPASAFDELALQSTAVLDVQCGLLGENSAIFANTPVATPSSGSPASYDVLFQFKSPLVAGSSLCSINITDSGSFPNGETAKNTSKQFRIIVSS